MALRAAKSTCVDCVVPRQRLCLLPVLRLAIPPARSAAMSADRALAPSMIGRHAQLAECEARLRLAQEGAGQVVLIAGEAGIGKSRLVREFLARAATAGDGLTILAGHCYAE